MAYGITEVDGDDSKRVNKLDFTDCILDSPVFRSTLKEKYSTFKDISNHFKVIVKNAQALKEQQKKTLAAYKVLWESIKKHPVPKGDDLTRDERIAYDSVKDFMDMIEQQETRSQEVQENGLDALIGGLQSYQKSYSENADSIKENYKKFEKATEKYCHSQEKYLSISTKKNKNDYVTNSVVSNTSFDETFTNDTFDVDRAMTLDTTMYHNVSTEMVWNVLEMEEVTRLNFIQYIYEFARNYLSSFVWGYLENVKRFEGYYPFLEEVITSSRNQLESTAKEADTLRSSILKDPQLALEQRRQQSYDIQGYLWVYECNKKKTLASATHSGLVASKYFCQYSGDELKMTQYHQVNPPKNLTVEKYIVKECRRRATSDSERQFLFDITLENVEKGSIELTFQAQSNEDRAQWLNIMKGTEPIYEDYRKFQGGQYDLDEVGMEFVKFIIGAIEREGGLEQEGPFRKPGSAKKVAELLEAYFVFRDMGPIMSDPNGVEVKTLTSALKRFLSELKEPLIPYHLYYKLINVAKNFASREDQLNAVHYIIHQMPETHFTVLKLVVQHLNKIIAASEKTKMSAPNVATCCGTSLLHSEGKSIANVMEIKFVNQIVLLILNNYDKIFETTPVSFLSTCGKFAGGGHSVRVANVKSDDSNELVNQRKSGVTKMRSSSMDSVNEDSTILNSSTTASGSLFKRDGVSRSSLKGSGRPKSLQTPSSTSRMKNSPSAHQISPTLSNENSSSHVSTSSSTNHYHLSQAEGFDPKWTVNPFGPKNVCVRALFDCCGDANAGELSFHANQIITNVTSTNEAGWLRGNLQGKTGLFPGNYCQILDQLDCFKQGAPNEA